MHISPTCEDVVVVEVWIVVAEGETEVDVVETEEDPSMVETPDKETGSAQIRTVGTTTSPGVMSAIAVKQPNLTVMMDQWMEDSVVVVEDAVTGVVQWDVVDPWVAEVDSGVAHQWVDVVVVEWTEVVVVVAQTEWTEWIAEIVPTKHINVLYRSTVHNAVVGSI